MSKYQGAFIHKYEYSTVLLFPTRLLVKRRWHILDNLLLRRTSPPQLGNYAGPPFLGFRKKNGVYLLATTTVGHGDGFIESSVQHISQVRLFSERASDEELNISPKPCLRISFVSRNPNQHLFALRSHGGPLKTRRVRIITFNRYMFIAAHRGS